MVGGGTVWVPKLLANADVMVGHGWTTLLIVPDNLLHCSDTSCYDLGLLCCQSRHDIRLFKSKHSVFIGVQAAYDHTTTPAPEFSTSTYCNNSSMAWFLVPALVEPRHFSTSAGATTSLVLAAYSPANLTRFTTHSTPFSWATALESTTIFLSESGLFRYGLKTGSLSDAEF